MNTAMRLPAAKHGALGKGGVNSFPFAELYRAYLQTLLALAENDCSFSV
ncbi:MAG: hypothetical protein ACUVWV_02665 [Thermodesulfobacteriota bacterium]